MINVSVIIPAYNVERYIREALDSIVLQTLKSIEVIVIDDGSTDNTSKIIEEYIKKYKNIVSIKQENQGQGIARNQGLEIAKGKYVYFFDADDILEKNALEICFEECESQNLDIVCFEADIFEDNDYTGTYGDYLIRRHLLESKVKKGEEFLVEAANKNCFRTESCINFYNREFLNEHKIQYSTQRIYEDNIQVTRAFLNAQRVKFIPYTFFKRRLRNNSAITRKRSMLNIDAYYRVGMDVLDIYKKNNNITKETKDILLRLSKYYMMRSISVCDEISDIKYKVKLINSIPKELYDINVDIQKNQSNLFYRNIGIKVNY